MPGYPQSILSLSRDVVAMQIPSGERIALPSKTLVRITQTLGGNFTVEVPSIGGLFRIEGKDADALGVEMPEEAKKAAEATAGAGPSSAEGVEKAVWEQLKTVFDPEIPINIVELGLVYNLEVKPVGNGFRIEVKMTLTAPGCGMGAAIADDAKRKIESVPGVAETDVELVWEPVWGPNMMSEAAKLTLGFM
ncbi:MAG TPA: putative Fe-S cluster assembly protein SufT [Thermoanaerobaculia bacterium]|nr:putative Fe-S cluster assembly protein SufT [Thermoanaerobaculia bacterium]